MPATGPRLLVLHDDPAREFAYTAGAKEALKQADREGWTVVSLKNDWATVFATDEIDGGPVHPHGDDTFDCYPERGPCRRVVRGCSL